MPSEEQILPLTGATLQGRCKLPAVLGGYREMQQVCQDHDTISILFVVARPETIRNFEARALRKIARALCLKHRFEKHEQHPGATIVKDRDCAQPRSLCVCSCRCWLCCCQFFKHRLISTCRALCRVFASFDQHRLPALHPLEAKHNNQGDMRRSTADQTMPLPVASMQYAYAGSQHDIQPFQRTGHVHNSAGRALYLPFERQQFTTQHPCASRLHPVQGKQPCAAGPQALSANFTDRSSVHRYMQAATEPLRYPHHLTSGHQSTQGRSCMACMFLSAATNLLCPGLKFYCVLVHA